MKSSPATVRQSGRKAVFLDRDGVINALVYHRDTASIAPALTESQFKLLPKVPEAIRRLNKLKMLVIVVSNQPGIANGRSTLRDLQKVERKLIAEISEAGAWIDGAYYCIHHPQARIARLRKRCSCRKPKIGMLRTAARRFGLSLKDCYMVGDSITDMVTGRRAGCKTIFVGRWKCELCQLAHDGRNRPDFVAPDLWGAARVIQKQLFSTTAPFHQGCCIAIDQR